MSEAIVCKFGGSSVATADQIRRVEDIVRSDEKRRYIVVSAPGKAKDQPNKVTDLLYNLYFKTHPDADISSVKYTSIPGNPQDNSEELRTIFQNIQQGLNLELAVFDSCMNELAQLLRDPGSTPDQIASRGENFNARLIAQYLGATFVDAADLIYITEESKDGDHDVTMHQISQRLGNIDGIKVIPGFYGLSSLTQQTIRTFERGGSDLTGSLTAAGVSTFHDGVVYENWTDQPGIRCCDPRLFDDEFDVAILEYVSFRETRELTYMGFEVFNDKAIGPVKKRKIPINIKNTNNPKAEGTWILDSADIPQEYREKYPIRGIAGKNGFGSINIEKYLMDDEVGFGRKVLSILEEREISYEHTPDGIDNLSVVLEHDRLKDKEEILAEIRRRLRPDSVGIQKNLALIAVVGEGMRHKIGVAASITSCLARNNINIEIINQGASESNVIIGVDSNDYQRAIVALYNDILEKQYRGK